MQYPKAAISFFIHSFPRRLIPCTPSTEEIWSLYYFQVFKQFSLLGSPPLIINLNYFPRKTNLKESTVLRLTLNIDEEMGWSANKWFPLDIRKHFFCLAIKFYTCLNAEMSFAFLSYRCYKLSKLNKECILSTFKYISSQIHCSVCVL